MAGLGSFSSTDAELTDARAGANDQAVAIGGGKKSTAKSNYGSGAIQLDFSGVGAITNIDKSRSSVTSSGFHSGGSGQPAGKTTSMASGNVSITTSIIQNDPAAALASIENSKALADLSINASKDIVTDVLERSTTASEKQQSFVEKTVSDAVNAVKELALPANERGFNTTLFVVGGLTLFFLYQRYNKKL